MSLENRQQDLFTLEVFSHESTSTGSGHQGSYDTRTHWCHRTVQGPVSAFPCPTSWPQFILTDALPYPARLVQLAGLLWRPQNV